MSALAAAIETACSWHLARVFTRCTSIRRVRSAADASLENRMAYLKVIAIVEGPGVMRLENIVGNDLHQVI
jgi:hypothetical protein